MSTQTSRYYAEVLDLLAMLTAAGFELLGVDDGDGDVVHHSSPEAAADAICGVDEAHLYVRAPANAEGKRKSLCLFLVLGNSPGELVCDYHDVPVLTNVVTTHADKWEAASA